MYSFSTTFSKKLKLYFKIKFSLCHVPINFFFASFKVTKIQTQNSNFLTGTVKKIKSFVPLAVVTSGTSVSLKL